MTTPRAHLPQGAVPSPEEWNTIRDMAQTLVESCLLPRVIDTAEKAAAIILKGRELGIPAMQSFSHIHIIDGKPACSAELMLALLARGDVTWDWEKDGTDRKEAVIVFHRQGFQPILGRFTIREAKRIETTQWENGQQKTIKLIDKTSWQNYPANLLRARAVSNGARMIGPDLLVGMSYTPEELDAEVNVEGEPIQTEESPAVTSDPLPAASRRPSAEGINQDGKHDKPFTRFLRKCAALKEELGDERYIEIMKRFGLRQPSEVAQDDINTMKAVVTSMEAESDAAAVQPHQLNRIVKRPQGQTDEDHNTLDQLSCSAISG
jgi:hypothetical protein